MSRRRFRPLNITNSPTWDHITRRKPTRRTFRQLQGGKVIPPVPYPGAIMRLMQPTAITDTEGLQTAADWGTGNYKPWSAWNYTTRQMEFIGNEIACYTLAMAVPTGTGEVIQVTQPLRWACIEPSAANGGFEFFDDHPSALNGFEGGTTVRPSHQAFASSTLLPVSGNSHAEASTPYRATMPRIGNLAAHRTCYTHVGSTIGDWVVFGTSRPSEVRSPPFYIIGRYVQWRINGSAVGPVHDLKAFYEADVIEGFTLYNSQGRNPGLLVDAPFPSTHQLWTSYGGLLENWNLTFDAGDTIEVDVWYEIGGRRQAAGDRSVTISFGRHYTNNAQVFFGLTQPTPSPGFTIQQGFILTPQPLEIYGLNMSNGFNPATHTYQFEPQDGAFTFGKAQASGAVRFSVTSKRLEWTFNEAETGGEGTCGTSTWQVQEVEAALQWVMISNDCTGGGTPVAPTSDPSEAGLEETTSCNCGISSGGDWQFSLELVYEYEMVYLKVSGTRPSPLPRRSFTVYYRPESSGDYVDTVNDRWDGTMKSGPTGVFNHMGATTFKHWRGVQQTSGAYDDSIPSTYSAISSLIPTEILVTRVAQ